MKALCRQCDCVCGGILAKNGTAHGSLAIRCTTVVHCSGWGSFVAAQGLILPCSRHEQRAVQAYRGLVILLASVYCMVVVAAT